MKAIEGIDLKSLVEQSSAELLDEMKSDSVRQIKSLFCAVRNLSMDIASMEKDLEKKRRTLVEKEQSIERLKAGDWSILSDKSGKAEAPQA